MCFSNTELKCSWILNNWTIYSWRRKIAASHGNHHHSWDLNKCSHFKSDIIVPVNLALWSAFFMPHPHLIFAIILWNSLWPMQVLLEPECSPNRSSLYVWLKFREIEQLVQITQLLSGREVLEPSFLTPKPTLLALILPCAYLWLGTCWHLQIAWPGCGKEKAGCHPPRRWPQSYSDQSCQECR